MTHRTHDGTDQGIFTAVTLHLFEQGAPAKTGEMCAYRDDRGRSCAIGCMIPDDRYMDEFEGRTAYDPDILKSAGINPLSGPQVDLAISLQRVHDSNGVVDVGGGFDRDILTQKLQCIADRFGLTMPEIPAAPAA